MSINNIILFSIGCLHILFIILFIILNKDLKKTIIQLNNSISLKSIIKIFLYGLYILGHLTIIILIIYRIYNYHNISNNYLTLCKNVGIIAHTLLFISSLFIEIVNPIVGFVLFLYLFGQIGMINLYIDEYNINYNIIINIVNKFIIILSLICICIFFILQTLNSDKLLSKIQFISMVIVYILWIVYFYKNIVK